MNYIPNLKYKTVLCDNWETNQQCLKGINCYFAHGSNDLRTIAQNLVLVSDQNKKMLKYNNELNLPSNYKTIRCRFFAKGKCQLGKNCTFYHSKKEKRQYEVNEDSQNFNNPQAYIQNQPIYSYNYPSYWNWNNLPYSGYQSHPQEGSLLNSPYFKSEESLEPREQITKEAEEDKKKEGAQNSNFLQSSIETNESLQNNFQKLSI